MPALAEHFLALACRRLGAEPPPLRRKHVAQLQAYDWPGNVRELQNTMERAAITSRRGEVSFDLGGPQIATAAAVTRGGGGRRRPDRRRSCAASSARTRCGP